MKYFLYSYGPGSINLPKKIPDDWKIVFPKISMKAM